MVQACEESSSVLLQEKSKLHNITGRKHIKKEMRLLWLFRVQNRLERIKYSKAKER